MLHKEFAINPDQIQSLPDLRLLEARFGYDKGALISAFPKKWFREVAGRLSTRISARGADNISDRLKAFKAQSIANFSREFKAESWEESVKISHDDKPFHRIVEPSQKEPPVVIASIHDLEQADFTIPSQIEQRTATLLADAGAALLVPAEKVTVFDPYIDITKPGCQKTLSEMMGLCKKQSVRFHVFSGSGNSPEWSYVLNALQNFSEKIPSNIELHWHHVHDKGSGYFHSRGFFTSKGGITYDKGFIEPPDRDQRETPMDVHIMTQSTLEQKSRNFNDAQLADRLVLENNWNSKTPTKHRKAVTA